jgi:transposase
MQPCAPVSPYQRFVGIDIAANSATMAWVDPASPQPTPALTISQDEQGWAQLEQALARGTISPRETLVVMEATGSYWISLATHLHERGFRVSVINPAQAHYFAKSLLQRSKSDAIDAQVLARLAGLLQPKAWTPPPAIYEELQQRLGHRQSLLGIRQQLRNQLHALERKPQVVQSVRASLQELIEATGKQIEQLEGELGEALRQEKAWQEAAQRLQSIPGVGLLTAAWLVSSTLNFSLCASAEAAVAYAGLAPIERRSGSSVRGRASIGHAGHSRLRGALYLATLSATRFNPLIRSFYQRLRAGGKPMKVARCAAARKLLCIAWAVVRKGLPFDPNHIQRQPIPKASS